MAKGQGALEYLITYGWAILIIVIIGGALFALGVFNPGTFSSNKRATGFSSLHISDWKLATEGMNITVANRFGAEINVTQVNATNAQGSCVSNTIPSGVVLAPDATTTINTNAACVGTLKTGNSYSLSTTVTFLAGTISHTDSGTITGKLE